MNKKLIAFLGLGAICTTSIATAAFSDNFAIKKAPAEPQNYSLCLDKNSLSRMEKYSDHFIYTNENGSKFYFSITSTIPEIVYGDGVSDTFLTLDVIKIGYITMGAFIFNGVDYDPETGAAVGGFTRIEKIEYKVESTVYEAAGPSSGLLLAVDKAGNGPTASSGWDIQHGCNYSGAWTINNSEFKSNDGLTTCYNAHYFGFSISNMIWNFEYIKINYSC